jgi:hypothetical protein
MVISVDLGATEYNVNGQYVSNQAFTEVSLLTTSSTTICQLMGRSCNASHSKSSRTEGQPLLPTD